MKTVKCVCVWRQQISRANEEEEVEVISGVGEG